MSYIKLQTYMQSKLIKQEVKLSNVVYPFNRFEIMGVNAIKSQELCKL